MSSCIMCGYCCTVATCSFGKWHFGKNQCAYLTVDKKCAIYTDIIKDPTSILSPSFGTGCSSSLFNEVRDKKIKELKIDQKTNKLE